MIILIISTIMRNTRTHTVHWLNISSALLKLYSEITQSSTERYFRILLEPSTYSILWMSFAVCLMYWMYSAMLWRKSHMSQLLREGQAFMMKWHFADIKIGQFVLDVLECSCWDAVSYQDEKLHVFFPLTDPRFKTAGAGCGCTTVSFVAHVTFHFSRQASCLGLTRFANIKK